MISIINVSEKLSRYGLNEYELRINNEVVANFTHERQQPLSKCLEQAMKAAEKVEFEKLTELMRSAL